jgi:hypothetical protein
VSSRQEEKERRRQERMSREAEIARAERRRKVMGYGLGGLLGVAAVAAIVVAVAAGGGDGGGGGGDGKGDRPKATGTNVPIPPPKETDLRKAARAAGCTLRSFTPTPNDRIHVDGRVKYEHNPPVFGQHSPTYAQDGNYVGVDQPATETVVHALEHGRVVLWYRPNLPRRRVQQLEALFVEPFEGRQEGYKQLVVAREGMPFQVAASSWGQQLGCRTFTDATFDAIRTFRIAYVDQAPERVPYPE